MARTTQKLSVAQALVKFLGNQYTVDEIDGLRFRERTIPGVFGIFGHGNVAGVGQALRQYQEIEPQLMPYYQGRNEQAQVHQAVGYARHTRRRQTFAVSTSIGPGATNMLTGAALATTNRLPALLLPADVFATRAADPVLQQLERPDAADVTVNDAFRPVARYFDRVWRPEQLFSALLNGMRVLTDPVETGAVVISLPQDVQAETLEVPEEFLAPREWRIRRPEAEDAEIRAAVEAIRSAHSPVIIAGGGVHYAFAQEQLRRFAEATGIPVAYTQAGVGVMSWDHPLCLGAVGSTGSTAANALVRDADLIIGIGTRYEDFTTASRTAFQHPEVRFVNINVASFDACKQGSSLPVVADARKALVKLSDAASGIRLSEGTAERIAEEKKRWDGIVDEAFGECFRPVMSQNEVIGRVGAAMDPQDVVICAAGSLPGDLHKMWRVEDPYGYHVEYAYSCMGYEIPGGLGVKRAVLDAQEERDVVVMVGDGSYLMMHTELVTAVAEGIKLIVVLLQNHGYASIGALSESLGSQRFGTRYRYLDEHHHSFDHGQTLPVDLAANAESLGVTVTRIGPGEEDLGQRLEAAVAAAKAAPEGSGPQLIHVDTLLEADAPSSESWWDVPVTATSELTSTQEAYQTYIEKKSAQRPLLGWKEQHRD